MALNLNEIFSPAAIAAYWTNDPTNAQPYASDALFPARKKVSMELKWLRGHKGVGVSLKGQLNYTSGNDAAMAMWGAVEEMASQVEATWREVWNS